MEILTKCFTKDGTCVTREIAGETLIVPIKNRVGDLDSIYTLNEVGTKIWQLIDQRMSLSQIVDEICRTYDVDQEEAARDAVEFVNSLQGEGLVRPSKDEVPLAIGSLR